MKFGADLKNSVVPEWAPGYIAYDALKAQIKAISGAEADERDALEETFFATLEEELEKSPAGSADGGPSPSAQQFLQ